MMDKEKKQQDLDALVDNLMAIIATLEELQAFAMSFTHQAKTETQRETAGQLYQEATQGIIEINSLIKELEEEKKNAKSS